MYDTLSQKPDEKCVELSKDLKESIMNHLAQAATSPPGSLQERYYVERIVNLSDEVSAVGCLVKEMNGELTKYIEDSN